MSMSDHYIKGRAESAFLRRSRIESIVDSGDNVTAVVTMEGGERIAITEDASTCWLRFRELNEDHGESGIDPFLEVVIKTDVPKPTP